MRTRRGWGLIRWSWGKTILALSWASVAVLGFYWGRCVYVTPAKVDAAPPPAQPATPPAAAPAPAATAPVSSNDYGREVVAYLYNTIPITRADLGEYLIARFGADRLDLLINKNIIEHACREKGIEVTAAEVETALLKDIEGFHINKLQFVQHVLKRYNKSLYEWKEDVIRPRLLMSKLCQDRITITDEDLKNAYDAYYGEKVVVRLILWPKEEQQVAMQKYATIRDKPEEFDRLSKQQASPQLASAAGLIDPIGHHTVGNDEVEREAFSLKPGELSKLIGTPEGFIVMKCVERKPPDTSKRLAEVQPTLEKEIREKKIALTIPIVFKELREAANPQRVLKGLPTQAEVEKEVEQELKQTGQLPGVVPTTQGALPAGTPMPQGTVPGKMPAPHGN